MRILYLIDSLVPGGAETSLAAMAPHLVAGGIELHVAYFHDRPGVQDALTSAGAHLRLLGPGAGRRDRIAKVRSAIREIKPDLLHTTLFEADIAGRTAARLERVPVSTSLVNDLYGKTHRKAAPAMKVHAARAVDAMTARFATRFHANSVDVGRVMGKRLHVRPDRIDVVFRGRDAAALGRRSADRRAIARRCIGVGPDTPLVLGVGRQEPQKGFDVLLRATPILRAVCPDARVVIAGREGLHTAHLRRLQKELRLGPEVEFLGHRDDVADLLCAADVLAFPTRREGLPGTLIEALALECPIVASDIPNVREVVADDATLVPVDDPAALAEALARDLPHSEHPPGHLPELTAMTGRGRLRFEELFTIERSAAGMIDFFHRVAAHPVSR